MLRSKKSDPGCCPRCDRQYSDLLEHITKKHRQERFTQAEVDHTNLTRCHCGRITLNAAGLVRHQLRFGCLDNTGRIPTPRPRLSSSLLSSAPPSPARRASSIGRSLSHASSSLPPLTPSTVRSLTTSPVSFSQLTLHEESPDSPDLVLTEAPVVQEEEPVETLEDDVILVMDLIDDYESLYEP